MKTGQIISGFTVIFHNIFFTRERWFGKVIKNLKKNKILIKCNVIKILMSFFFNIYIWENEWDKGIYSNTHTKIACNSYNMSFFEQ